MQSEATKTEATEISRSLIKKIVVSPTDQRGKSDVVLYGAWASILTHSTTIDQSGAVTSNVGRVLSVAGAGFTQIPTLQKKFKIIEIIGSVSI